MASTTHTRTHVYITFANPHLVCDLCRQPAPRWHNNDKCGCAQPCWLDTCRHNAEAVSVCPSWGPVDGCTCPGGPGSHTTEGAR